MLLAAFDGFQNASNREFPWKQKRRKRKRSSICDEQEIQKKRLRIRRRSNSPKEPAVLSVSKKRKRQSFSSPSSPVFQQRKKRMVAFENGSGVGSLGDLEKKLEKLQLGKHAQENKMEEEEPENSCTALLPVVQRDFKNHMKDIKLPTFFTVDKRLLTNPSPAMDPKKISSSVLEVLVQLGFVEKVNCYGEDVYVVLRQRFEPIFTRPTNYYFQNTGDLPSFVNRLKAPKKAMDTKTLIGLWLLLVKLGYFLPFPQIENYTHMFNPLNESRLEKLGSSWLKQLGITEEMLTDPALMDFICKKIVTSLRQGKGRLQNGNANDEDEIMIETIS
jgi:hypothetical protein